MIFNLINQGGPIFTYPIVLLLFVILFLLAKAFMSKGNNEKTIELISSVGLFTVVWGVLGMVIGLIGAFDIIEDVGSMSPGVLAGGLKISLITPTFGLVTFLIARLGIIALQWKNTNEGS